MTKEVFLKKLGKNVARLREEAGFTQAEFALKCDKDKQSMNRIEKGRINPTAYSLLQLAVELDIPLKNLLDFE